MFRIINIRFFYVNIYPHYITYTTYNTYTHYISTENRISGVDFGSPIKKKIAENHHQIDFHKTKHDRKGRKKNKPLVMPQRRNIIQNTPTYLIPKHTKNFYVLLKRRQKKKIFSYIQKSDSYL